MGSLGTYSSLFEPLSTPLLGANYIFSEVVSSVAEIGQDSATGLYVRATCSRQSHNTQASSLKRK